MLAYDPLTGSLTWLKSPSKNTEAGSEAGCVKGSRVHKKTGLVTAIGTLSLMATKALLPVLHGACTIKNGRTATSVFVDSDPSNFRISNLSLAMFKTVRVDKGGLVQHKMSKEASRHYGYKRYYGMDFADYVALAAAQKNVCAICEQPETHVMHGKVKPLSVDHNHSTGSVRGLLCASCNHMLGHAKRIVLRSFRLFAISTSTPTRESSRSSPKRRQSKWARQLSRACRIRRSRPGHSYAQPGLFGA